MQSTTVTFKHLLNLAYGQSQAKVENEYDKCSQYLLGYFMGEIPVTSTQ